MPTPNVNCEYEMFRLQETQIAKGIAIILMLIHHLFTFPERIKDVSYIPLFQSVNLEFWFGDFGGICVPIFLFLSGYGMYKSSYKYSVRDIYLKRLLNFYKRYWICFIVFAPIGTIFFNHFPNYHWNIRVFLLSFFGFDQTYNAEWWFVQLYIEIIMLSPLIYKILKNCSIHAFFVSWLIYSLPRKAIPDVPYLQLDSFCYWQFPFIIGCLFAQYDILNRIYRAMCKYRYDTTLNHLFVLAILFLFREKTRFLFFKSSYMPYPPGYIDSFLTPLFVYHIVCLFRTIKLRSIFQYLGKYTLYMWLSHTFFCYYFWQKVTFWPKYSFLVLAWLILLSLITSYILSALHFFIMTGLTKFQVHFRMGKVSKCGNDSSVKSSLIKTTLF